MNAKIPVSVLVMTRNEAGRIARCLAALRDFSEIVVVDSGSTDATADLSRAAGARVVDFQWDGRYPKKRQWCLDNLVLAHEWVFMVDADEMVTPELVEEIRVLFAVQPVAAGYFVKGRYVVGRKVLQHGLCNNKLALFDRRAMAFPVVDDLDLPGMGEIEGHYQPCLKSEAGNRQVGSLKNYLLHEAYESREAWMARHQRYAAWEAGMNARNAWPGDPVRWRQVLKRVFRALPGRGSIAFAYSYFYKAGFLDGNAGFNLARDRWRYYRMIAAASNKVAAPRGVR